MQLSTLNKSRHLDPDLTDNRGNLEQTESNTANHSVTTQKENINTGACTDNEHCDSESKIPGRHCKISCKAINVVRIPRCLGKMIEHLVLHICM